MPLHHSILESRLSNKFHTFEKRESKKYKTITISGSIEKNNDTLVHNIELDFIPSEVIVKAVCLNRRLEDFCIKSDLINNEVLFCGVQDDKVVYRDDGIIEVILTTSFNQTNINIGHMLDSFTNGDHSFTFSSLIGKPFNLEEINKTLDVSIMLTFL